MQLAAEAFQKGDIPTALSLYTSIIDDNQTEWKEALLNRSSAYYSQGDYVRSFKDVERYIQSCQPAQIQGFILYANCIIKQKMKIDHNQRGVLERGKKEHPYHKKYLDVLKIVEQIQIVEEEEDYLDKIFQKLLSDNRIRQWMQEEPFLTKVEKMIKNPALSSALIKMDARLAEVQEAILMAEE